MLRRFPRDQRGLHQKVDERARTRTKKRRRRGEGRESTEERSGSFGEVLLHYGNQLPEVKTLRIGNETALCFAVLLYNERKGERWQGRGENDGEWWGTRG